LPLGPAAAEVEEPGEQQYGDDDQHDVGHVTTFLSAMENFYVSFRRVCTIACHPPEARLARPFG
jgi:hypothetical protein